MEPTFKPEFYRVVIIRLPFDIRDTIYYSITTNGVCIEPGSTDAFASILLDMLKDPIMALASIFDELHSYSKMGLLKPDSSDESEVDERFILRKAGKEMSDIIDHICDMFKSNPDELQFYNHATIVNHGLVLMHIRCPEDLDAVPIS
jgi:hypothetical protein